MNNILDLAPTIRLLILFFMIISIGALLSSITIQIICKRKQLYNIYLISIFLSLLILSITRTPIIRDIPILLSTILNYALIVPFSLGILCFIQDKKIIYILDSIWFLINLPFFSFIPYYGYIISFLFSYMLYRSFIIFFDNVDRIKINPGALSIKYALDDISEGIAFFNTFGQITYINQSLKDILKKLNISSFSLGSDIISSLLNYSLTKGRYISENSFIIHLEDKSYKFSFDHPLTQIASNDITEEEMLTMEMINKRQQLFKNNEELTLKLKSLANIKREKEILTMRGHLHDDLAQKLSILHMFILNDESNNLVELKNMISMFKINPEEAYKEEDVNDLIHILAEVGIKLSIEGEYPKEVEIQKFLNKVIKETTTNAIRHGKANNILINITNDNKNYLFSITNDGIIPENIAYGNGLNSIIREIEQFNGSIKIDTNSCFKITLNIPKEH